MLLIKSNERGSSNAGWLDSKHSFSFGQYYNPENMGFRTLRVINEDVVAPSSGFPSHSHRNMEILTYVLSGQLAHADSMGNKHVIKAGEFQKMTAGQGVMHSEFNASSSEECHFYQIWILPKEENLEPSYQQKDFTAVENSDGSIIPVLTPDGRENSMTLNQNAEVHLGTIKRDGSIPIHNTEYSHAYVQVLEGEVTIKRQELSSGDGLGLPLSPDLAATAISDARVLVFYLD